MRNQLTLMLAAMLFTTSIAGAQPPGGEVGFVHQTYVSIPGGVRVVPQTYAGIAGGVTVVGETYDLAASVHDRRSCTRRAGERRPRSALLQLDVSMPLSASAQFCSTFRTSRRAYAEGHRVAAGTRRAKGTTL